MEPEAPHMPCDYLCLVCAAVFHTGAVRGPALIAGIDADLLLPLSCPLGQRGFAVPPHKPCSLLPAAPWQGLLLQQLHTCGLCGVSSSP